MKNEEILKKAIEKAMANGYQARKDKEDYLIHAEGGWYLVSPKDFSRSWGSAKDNYWAVFSHDFAKAFWGMNHICRWCGESKLETKTDFLSGEKNTVCMGCGAEAMDYNEFPKEGNMMRKWQYHLQQMVLEEDPIKYLEKFI